MNLVSDDSRIFLPIFITVVYGLFMNSTYYIFDVNYVAKIRSGLFITVLEEKLNKVTTSKKQLQVLP